MHPDPPKSAVYSNEGSETGYKYDIPSHPRVHVALQSLAFVADVAIADMAASLPFWKSPDKATP